MSSRLDGKVAVVTGGASGVGAATGRLCLPEDVADVVVFLASEEARYVSAGVVRVNGGGSRATAW